VLGSAPGSAAVLVLDGQGRPRRWVGAPDLQRADGRPLDQIGMHPEAVIEPHATLSDALNELITARYSVATVVDANGVYQGIVDIDRITEAIRTMRSDNQRTARRGLDEAPDAAGSR
jgi:osmoprotectant transport system ATP-binding protein